ncbi:MAG: hypothetical protein IPK26_05725 [Planctomycetes bacterium]|nr:hypothetical protein [Planctomycetota bacterium]
MPSPKSGKQITPDAPTAATEPAAVDPGKQAKATGSTSTLGKASATSTRLGAAARSAAGAAAGGAGAAAAAAQAASEQEPEPEQTWFEFQVLGADDQPVADQELEVTFKDGHKEKKKTDGDGVVRIADVKPDDVVGAVPIGLGAGEWSELGPGERRQKTQS